MLCPAFGLPGVTLDGLQLADDVFGESAGGFQLVHDRICDTDGIAQGHALVDERLLQLLGLIFQGITVSFLGCFAGSLNGSFLCGEPCRGGKPVVCGCKIDDFAALVYQPFQIFAVLLDDFVLDLLVFLRTFFGGFKTAHERVDVVHLLVQLLAELGGCVPGFTHLLCIFGSAVTERFYSDDNSSYYGKD